MTQQLPPIADMTGGSVPDRNVIPKLWEYMNHVHLQFPWINGLEKARPADTAWEIIGQHSSGLIISVRGHLEHGIRDQEVEETVPCSMAYDTKEGLNTYIEKHLNETKRTCLTGFKFIVLLRDSKDAFGGLNTCNHTLTKLTNVIDDMTPVCNAIRTATSTLVDTDTDLDMHDSIQHYYYDRPSNVSVMEVMDKDGDMEMDDGGDDENDDSDGIYGDQGETSYNDGGQWEAANLASPWVDVTNSGDGDWVTHWTNNEKGGYDEDEMDVY
jgi:hypothetical protein